MKDEYIYFINLIRYVYLDDKIIDKSTFLSDLNCQKSDEFMEFIINCAKFHNVDFVIFKAIKDLKINIYQNLFNKLAESAKSNAYKSIMQSLEIEAICNELSELKIKHLPMKGALLQKLYPKVEYRSMADIDILVPIAEIKEVGKCLVKLGYTAKHIGGNHDSYIKAPYINIEVHRRLIDESFATSSYYNNIWDKLINVGKYQYALSDDDFYIFLLIHAVKHFSHGGNGIRTLIDIYIYLKEKKVNFEYVYQELDKLQLSKFAKIMLDCSNYIFDKDLLNNSLEDVEFIIEHIFNSGSYGTIQNSSINDVIKNEIKSSNDIETSKKKVIFKRLFPDFSVMKRRNPILKKFPILLPWFYFTRLIKGIFNIKHHKSSYNQIKNIDLEQIEKMKKINKILGVNDEN